MTAPVWLQPAATLVSALIVLGGGYAGYRWQKTLDHAQDIARERRSKFDAYLDRRYQIISAIRATSSEPLTQIADTFYPERDACRLLSPDTLAAAMDRHADAINRAIEARVALEAARTAATGVEDAAEGNRAALAEEETRFRALLDAMRRDAISPSAVSHGSGATEARPG